MTAQLAQVELAVMMGIPPRKAMYLTTDLKPNTDFTKIMNEVIFDDGLTHAEFRLWCRLLAMPKGAEQVLVDVDEISKRLGMSATNFRQQRKNLKEKGYLTQQRNRLIITIPGQDFKPKQVKPTKEQQQREDLRETWNAAKPDGYTRMRNPFSLDQVETLKAHAEHNGQSDLCQFLMAVLKGCKADDWWKTKNLNFGNVFGTGIPKQNKFTNVEKLAKLSSSKKGQAALFDDKDDQCWLDWFNSKSLEMSKVVRLEMEQDDAWVHQVDNEGDGTIYIYTHEDRLVHWTYKENHVGVSYLPTAR